MDAVQSSPPNGCSVHVSVMGTAPGVVKQAMALTGWDMGPSRSPVALLSPDKRAKLKEILTEAGLA